MSAEQLFAQFQRVCDAPDAVPRLRRFVLDLAVRGKLVQQDSSDEPVAELLRRIATEKARLVKEGGVRKPRELDRGGVLAEPFAIPATWQWVRLDTVGAIVGGGTPSAIGAEKYAPPGAGIPWLTPADLGGHTDSYISHGARDLSREGFNASSATLMPAGTVLFTSRAPIGYVAIAANPVSTSQGFKSVVPFVADCASFIATVMRAFAPDIRAKAPGTTFKEVSGKIVAGISFPLPPLAEQNRIVVKVNELMALCDGLDVARAKREVARERLAVVSLVRLNTPHPDPATFNNHAQFALNNVTALTSHSRQIKQLRQTILNLAVRAKLVAQDTLDEPATELLKRIAAERAELVNSRLIRNDDPLDAVQLTELPFAVPSSWTWSRIGDAILFTQYGTSQQAQRSDTGIPVLTMGNIQDGLVVCGNENRIPSTSEELPKLLLRKFDLLYNRTNSAELVGKTGIYLGEPDVRTFASYLIRLRPSLNWTDPRFLNIAMNTTQFRETQIVPLIKKQTGQANVNGTALKNMLIPLPPLLEQRRIVAKVDELMVLCQRLEASIAAGYNVRSRVLDALLAEALVPVARQVPGRVEQIAANA